MRLPSPILSSNSLKKIASSYIYVRQERSSSETYDRAPRTILEFPLPTQPIPRPAGVIRGAYTCAVQAYSTFSLVFEVVRPTSKAREKRPGEAVRHFLSNCSLFLARNFAVSLYFVQMLLRNAKLARGCQNCRKFCFTHQRCSRVTKVFYPRPG